MKKKYSVILLIILIIIILVLSFKFFKENNIRYIRYNGNIHSSVKKEKIFMKDFTKDLTSGTALQDTP